MSADRIGGSRLLKEKAAHQIGQECSPDQQRGISQRRENVRDERHDGAGKQLALASREGLSFKRCGLEDEYFIYRRVQLSRVLKVDEARVLALEIVVGDPTGHGAAASDMDGNAVLNDLCEGFFQRRPAHGND